MNPTAVDDGGTSPHRVEVAGLRAAMEAALRARGVPDDDATWTVHTLVTAELEGSAGHGLVRLLLMLQRLDQRLTNATPEIRELSTTDAAVVLDGDNGLGQVVLARAADRAVELAQARGVGFVAVQGSNHAGRIGDAALRGAAAGCLTLVGSNASPRLVPEPGARRLLGNNPLACAAPGTEHPVLIDVAPGVTTVGSIRRAKLEGRTLPEGVALDVDGQPTTDATDALAGAMLGVGGHKGWVLALLVDLLAGVVSGGATGDQVGATNDLSRIQRVAHVVIALDVRVLTPGAGFEARIDDLRERVAAASDRKGRLPGDRRANQGYPDYLMLSDKLVAALADALDLPLTALTRSTEHP